MAGMLKAIKSPVGRRAIAHLETHRPDWLPRLTRRRGGRVERLFWQSGGGYDRNIDDRIAFLRSGSRWDRSAASDGAGSDPSHPSELASNAGWLDQRRPRVGV